jgi:ABC-2 type transport system permease protein
VIFAVPVVGSLALLLLSSIPFIAANLAVGITFSTVAQNQLQAVQMAFFYFLPSILLSGFMFPFQGMPKWAQVIGSALPLTYYLRVVRGIVLKGNGFLDIFPQMWPMLVFLAIMMIVAVKRYRQTLD